MRKILDWFRKTQPTTTDSSMDQTAADGGGSGGGGGEVKPPNETGSYTVEELYPEKKAKSA